MKLFAHSNGHRYEFDLEPEGDRMAVRLGERRIEISLDEHATIIRTAFLGNRKFEFGWHRQGSTYSIHIDGIKYDVTILDPKEELLSKIVRAGPAAEGSVEVKAPIPGLITRVVRKAGTAVKKGEPVLYLDAMKLENEIGSPREGTLRSITVSSGQSVNKGQVLFVVG